MGRPPLNVKPVLVRLPEASIAKIDDLVGPFNRAKFIREAVETEIERRERSARLSGSSKPEDDGDEGL